MKTTLTLLLLFPVLLFSQATWNMQHGTGGNLWAVSFGDANNGWACGNGGIMLHTTNGGLNWNSQSNPGNSFNIDVQFISPQEGWFTSFNSMGMDGKVCHTTNGGASWQMQRLEPNYGLRQIFFLDAMTGWISCDSGYVLRTTNGGAAWTPVWTGQNAVLTGIHFIDANNGWTCGTNGVVYRTTNGGTSWQLAATVTSFSPTDVFMLDATTGWLCGETPSCPAYARLAKTTNGGLTWVNQSVNPNWGGFNDVYFSDPQHGWLASGSGCSQDHGGIVATTDGGLNWNTDIVPDSTPVWSLCIFDPAHMWSAGHDGYILHPASAVAVAEFAAPALLSVFPNPATTELYLQLPGNDAFSYTIVDIFGKTVHSETAVTERSIDISSLATGVYMLRTMVNGEVAIGRFIKE